MTPSQFRKIALSLPAATEYEHGGHPDFRVGGKVFASLGAPNDEWAMVKLTPEQQQALRESLGDAYLPCAGAWGRRGYTNIRLASAATADVRSALQLAFELVGNSRSTKKPKVKPLAASQPRKSSSTRTDAKTETNDSEAVISKLASLEHPLKPVIEKMRSTILKADGRITEGIKWNSPSFYCHGWFATFHLKAKSGITLVLHHGAKIRSDSTLANTIVDPANLLQWASADRATVTVTSTADFKKKQTALKSIIQQWVEFQVASNSI